MLKVLILNPWFGFLMGLSLAALLRSSNTMVILIQSMVGVEIGLSPAAFLTGAIAIIIGANVGTSLINILLGLDRIPTVKRANWLHFGFNLTTALIWLMMLPLGYLVVHELSQHLSAWYHQITASVFRWSPQLLSERWFNIWELAMAHTFFNLSVVILWVPITIGAFKLGLPIFAEHTKLTASETSYLDRRALHSPALALILANHEINQMAVVVMEMLRASRLAFLRGQLHLVANVDRDEAITDDFQEQITFYLSALLSQNTLTEAQSHRLAGLLQIVSDIERIGDHAFSIAKLAEKKHQEQLPFSELALNEIELFFNKAIDLYTKTLQVLREDDLELAKQIMGRDENFDKLEEELRQNHINRLNHGKCWPGSGVVYVELLSNLLRVSAHSASIASRVLEEGEA